MRMFIAGLFVVTWAMSVLITGGVDEYNVANAHHETLGIR